MQEFTRLEIGTAALHRLDQDCRQLVRARLDDFHRLRRAVIEHDHVVRGAGHDARCRWYGAQFFGRTHNDFIKDAVVGTSKKRDQVSSGHGARDAHRAHHGLRPGVAQSGAIKAGHFANELGDLTGEWMLRPDLIAIIELLFHRVVDERGLPAEQIHAKTVKNIDVFVAVDIPKARAPGAVDDDLVNHFLQ